jgi:hypothetical protein
MNITRQSLRQWVDYATIVLLALTGLAQLSYDLGTISTLFPDAWRPYITAICGSMAAIGAFARTLLTKISSLPPPADLAPLTADLKNSTDTLTAAVAANQPQIPSNPKNTPVS